jgi:hypothetical protein
MDGAENNIGYVKIVWRPGLAGQARPPHNFNVSNVIFGFIHVQLYFLMTGYSTCETCRRFDESVIQGVSRLVYITEGGDFLGLCDQKSSYKHVSDFGRLRSYDRLKLRIEGSDY